MTARIRIGTSGWVYAPWRGTFYPDDLPQRRELEHLSGRLATTEINGSFYSMQRPEHYRRWAASTPEDFVFAVKGGRFITHMKKLRDVHAPLANFFASGVLALGERLGPLLWQLPPSLGFDAERLADFFARLPRTTAAAAELAEDHDARLEGRALTEVEVDGPLRHAVEVRHPSFRTREFVSLLRAHDIGLVVADTAGRWPQLTDATSDFVYLRLHGDQELYASGYTGSALDSWAELIRAWQRGDSPATEHALDEPVPAASGRDVYVYFDNDIKAHAPFDAMALAERCGSVPSADD